MKAMLRKVAWELTRHIPFTMIGSLGGIVVVWATIRFRMPRETSELLFWTFHPLHVFLSALTTTAMFRRYSKRDLWITLCIGYVGSVGIATLSDSLIPFLAELLLDLPHRHLHVGCVTKWWLVNPVAIAGMLAAFKIPSTKFPHAGHVLLSTGASLFHVTMAMGPTCRLPDYFVIAVFLFLAVWIPCCTSDIIFPLLFIKETRKTPETAAESDRSTQIER